MKDERRTRVSAARQLGGEIDAMLARGRTRFGFAAIAGVATVLALIFQLPGVQFPLRRLLESAHYDPQLHLSGPTLAVFVLRFTVLLIGAPFVALVAGDIVAKDEEEGTLRMRLCRPVSRLRVLAIKWLASALYAIALPIFIGLLALALGLALWGGGSMFVYGPLEGVFAAHPFAEGTARYLAALPLFGLTLLPVHAVAFMLSCHAIKPAAATVGALAFILADYLLRSIPFLHSVAEGFLTARMVAWLQVFQPGVPWDRIIADYTFLAALEATLFVIAWVRFEARDLKP